MEDSISLKEIFTTLKKHLILIASITLLATAISGSVSYFLLKPVYNSSTQILVSQAAAGALASIPGMTFDADEKYIETYNVIMKSPYILDKVIEELKMDTTHDAMNGSVNVRREGQSQVVTLTVQNHDPAKAVLITNEIAKVFQREISKLMHIDNIHILSPAELNDNPSPIKPQPTLNMAIAFMFGLLVSIVLAFLLEHLDNTVKTEEDIEKLLGLPVLGAIIHIKPEEQNLNKNKHNRGESVGN